MEARRGRGWALLAECELSEEETSEDLPWPCSGPQRPCVCQGLEDKREGGLRARDVNRPVGLQHQQLCSAEGNRFTRVSFFYTVLPSSQGFLGGSVVKNLPTSAGDLG